MASTRARIASRPMSSASRSMAANRSAAPARLPPIPAAPRPVAAWARRRDRAAHCGCRPRPASAWAGNRAARTAGRCRAGRAAASGAGQHVAADLFHVDGQLAHGLGRVHEIGDAVFARHRADRGGGIDQAAVGGQPSARSGARVRPAWRAAPRDRRSRPGLTEWFPRARPRSAISRMQARLPPHSCRPTRMRSPGCHGLAVANAAKAAPQPGELPPVSAISSGCALNSRAARARAVSVSARAPRRLPSGRVRPRAAGARGSRPACRSTAARTRMVEMDGAARAGSGGAQLRRRGRSGSRSWRRMMRRARRASAGGTARRAPRFR